MTKDEIEKEVIGALGGYTPEQFNCANAETALSEIFDQEMNQEPMMLLRTFIMNCSNEEFHRLKSINHQDEEGYDQSNG